ncbi:hypothetical protein [Winogradskyella aurantiaca]|uniref:hypothetical protein n=1 Tax=Winogradskyella aurantiaca TaxID=2219558 RepID=UPI0018E559E5|nr:hypothetical protein [Winogradskyella aurantiaca]
MKWVKRIAIAIVGFISIIVFSAYIYVTQVRSIKLSDTVPPIDQNREAKALTAFFGLDELPMQSLLLYYKAPGKNGMPLVFSQELDPATINSSDFEVTTKDGMKHKVEFVTLRPAEEEFELRTLLFIGEYGIHPENPPVIVKVVDDLFSRSGQNYKGQVIPVIPLPDGPTISYAEHFIIDDDYPYVESGRGCDCPKDETSIVVRTVWAGGVRALNGKELGDPELSAFTVHMVKDQDTIEVTPFKLADLGDNDNNIDLCLKEMGIPISVVAAANIAIDPRNDPNPSTKSRVFSRW